MNASLSPSPRSFSFVFALILSGLAHGLLFWLPNPLNPSATTESRKPPTLVRVVSLPATLKKVPIEQSALARSEEAAEEITEGLSEKPEKLAANITKPLSVEPLPSQRPLSSLDLNTPLPKTGMASSETKENDSMGTPNSEVPERTSPKSPEPKTETRPEPKFGKKTEPKIEPKIGKSSTSNPEPSIEATPTPKEKVDQPVLTTKKNAIARELESEPSEAFTSTLSSVYQQYGANNIVLREIAPANALVSPDKREG
jgi:hypothetical protein